MLFLQQPQFNPRLQNVLLSGVKPESSDRERRVLLLINAAALLTVGISIFLIISLAIIGKSSPEVLIVSVYFALAYTSIPVINRHTSFEIARAFGLLVLSAHLIYWNVFFYDTPYYLLLTLVVCNLLYKNLTIRLIGFSIYFGVFLMLKYVKNDTSWSSDLVFFDFLLFGSIGYLAIIVNTIVDNYEKKMTDLLNDLQAKNKDLEAQQRLKKSEQFFTSIFENDLLGFVRIDSQRVMQQVNQVFAAQLGYKIEELIGRDLLDFKDVTPEALQKFTALQEGQIRYFSLRLRFKQKNGNFMLSDTIVNGVFDENGNFIEAIFSIQDVTETYAAQRKIIESERRFRSLFNGTPVGIVITNLETQAVLEVNQRLLDILGSDRAEFLTCAAPQLFRSMAAAPEYAALSQSLINENIESLKINLDLQTATDAVLYAEISQNKILLNGVSCLITLVSDITEHRLLEEERKARYTEMQRLVDALPIAFMLIDKNMNIVRANEVIKRTFGQPLEGQNICEAFPELAETRLQEYQQILKDGVPSLNNIEEYEAHGSHLWVKINRVPYRNQQGEIVGVLIFAVDITDLKRTEAELTVKNAELQHYIETNLQLESFTYIASHDLKEPLRTVHSFTQLLHRRQKQYFDETSEEYMNFVLDGVTRMRQLLDDLLEYSTIGRKAIGLKTTDLNDTVYNVVQNLQTVIREKNAEIIFEQLPSVEALPSQMIQLFQNLVSNAIKFVRKDTQPVVRIKSVEKSNEWLFSIEDNGIGIAAEYVDKVFLVFKRLHSRQEYSGTGIGLATCKKIVETLGGKIWLTSEPQHGTTFFFTIPKKIIQNQ